MSGPACYRLLAIGGWLWQSVVVVESRRSVPVQSAISA